MKRLAILAIALATMGAGCWSSEEPTPITPPPTGPVMEQPQTPPTTDNPSMMPAPTPTSTTPENPVMMPATSTPSNPVMQPADDTVYATIQMSENGFKPAQITIKKNTIVRFMNVGNTDMWPASNSHPNHTDYPDFDARRNVKPGETYEFRFKNVGSWGCHDHLSPGNTCRIVVQE